MNKFLLLSPKDRVCPLGLCLNVSKCEFLNTRPEGSTKFDSSRLKTLKKYENYDVQMQSENRINLLLPSQTIYIESGHYIK
ncbi:MAG: hypothetical protein RBG13Loki_3206 [Promethearchaeota archaeon CR_4]|nr:MAG: hypothetical protein RBG13Loki_3206 [Candidatus Lokiarchaeota archaeon CR_4]